METVAKRNTTQEKSKGRLGLFLSPTQVGLVVGVALVGCMSAFGAGVIVGMWYKANEQITPYQFSSGRDATPASANAEARQQLTFYSRLKSPEGASTPPVAASVGTPPVASRPGVSPTIGTTASTPTPPHDDVGAAARRDLETLVATSVQDSAGAFSVQVGSFRTQKHAQRLRKELQQKGYEAYVRVFANTAEGSWYRVRVGNFTDRTTADRTRQRLQSQERLSAAVVAAD